MLTLITFGGPYPAYHERVKIVCEQAKKLNIFDDVRGFDETSLKSDTEFWNAHGEFVEKNQRGYGHWLWKPYLIKRTLADLSENDILVYMDAGCTINPYGIQRLNEYIDLLNSNDRGYGVLSFQMGTLEYKFTKKKVLDIFQADNEMKTSGQYMATIVLLRKNAHSQDFVNKWYGLASTHTLIDDSRSDVEYPGFIDHRHDQSIYSCLCKKLGTIRLEDETNFYPDWERGKHSPFWATRLPRMRVNVDAIFDTLKDL